MRFMVIVKATPDSEAGVMPPEELLLAMGKYNEELVKAGVMIEGDGLMASDKGARVHFAADGSQSVTDGPFAETKELIAGYWIWDCASLDEAKEWVRRMPGEPGKEGSVEIRRVFELADFGEGEGVDQHKKVADLISERDAGS